MTPYKREKKIAELLEERAAVCIRDGGSHSRDYRRITSSLEYYRNPDTRKKYLASLDKEDIRLKARDRYAKDPAKHIEGMRRYKAKNPGINGRMAKQYRERHPQAKIASRLRGTVTMTGMRRNFTGAASKRRPVGLEASVGCTREHLQLHIESQFINGMTWENRGTHWEIDHIKPLSKFNLDDEAEQRQANHFTNLRPVTRLQNLAKGHK